MFVLAVRCSDGEHHDAEGTTAINHRRAASGLRRKCSRLFFARGSMPHGVVG
jgi:hypothetical protein